MGYVKIDRLPEQGPEDEGPKVCKNSLVVISPLRIEESYPYP